MARSLTEIAELINFDYTDESRAEGGPIDIDEYWVMFANVRESTTIYLHIDD